MAGADFKVTVTEFREDESFEFSASWKEKGEGGTVEPFPWPDYTYEYTLRPAAGGGPRLTLTEGNGITVDTELERITFASATMPRAGRYEHSCLLTHIETGKKRVPFDGPVIIHGVR